MDQTLDCTLLPSSFPDYTSVEPLRQISHASLEGVLKLFAGREEPLDGAEDEGHILLKSVNDGVGSGVKCVGGDDLAGGTVELFDNSDDGSGNVVEVEDGRCGVEADGMERVAVGHGELGKFGEVSSLDSLRDLIHAFGDDPETLLQKGRCLYGLLHTGSGRSPLLGITDNTNKGVHLGPVLSRSNLFGERVGASRVCTFTPSDEASKERSAGRARALAGDEGKLGGRLGEGIERSERCNEGGQTRS